MTRGRRHALLGSRASTLGTKGGVQRTRAHALTADELAELEAARPRRRGDCAGGLRPCPFVACRYTLLVDVNPKTGSLKINHPGVIRIDGDGEVHVDLEALEALDELVATCSLDVAARGGETLDQVGVAMNLTRERVRQIEINAARKVSAALRALARHHEEDPHA